jgi:cathepsin L
MKAILVLAMFIGAAAVAAAASRPDSDYSVLFEAWRRQHGKEYKTLEEYFARKAIFTANIDMIEAHNAQKLSWTMGANAFTDLTHEEFKARYVGGLKGTRKPHYDMVEMAKLNATNVPSSVNWVNKGAVTGVKNQQQCGGCWAFSTTGATEGITFITTGQLISLSEQQLIDCSQAEGNQGCEGGLMDQAFQYVMDNKGITTETAYPYTATDGTCKCTSANACSDAVDISSFTDVAANSSSALIAAINLQPISVAVDASGMDWQFYSGGVVTDTACGTELDHGVIAVGYDTGASQPYYLVRNSWGASWGEQGYIRIGIADGAGICGIQMDPSYPDGATRVAKKLPKFAIRKH